MPPTCQVWPAAVVTVTAAAAAAVLQLPLCCHRSLHLRRAPCSWQCQAWRCVPGHSRTGLSNHQRRRRLIQQHLGLALTALVMQQPLLLLLLLVVVLLRRLEAVRRPKGRLQKRPAHPRP